jgi:hypothetical protein
MAGSFKEHDLLDLNGSAVTLRFSHRFEYGRNPDGSRPRVRSGLYRLWIISWSLPIGAALFLLNR